MLPEIAIHKQNTHTHTHTLAKALPEMGVDGGQLHVNVGCKENRNFRGK